jgi:hypothetical protein
MPISSSSSVFNTAFEVGLRVDILLDESGRDLDALTIQLADFVATYGKEFNISGFSAQGDNPYMYCEFESREALVVDALKRLVLDGYLLPSATRDGIVYRTTLAGHRFARSLDSDYADEYRDAAGPALELVNRRGTKAMLAALRARSEGATRKEDPDE